MLLNVKGAILIGIIATTIIGIFNGVTQVPDFSTMDFGVPSLAPTFFKLDIAGLFNDPSKIFLVLTTIFSFSLSDTFDTIGTFLGTGRKQESLMKMMKSYLMKEKVLNQDLIRHYLQMQ